MAADDGYPITEPDPCRLCAEPHAGRGPGLIGPLCGFVAGLAAALVSALMVTIVDPPGGELTVAPPADARYCAAVGGAAHSPPAGGSPASGVPVLGGGTRP